MNLWSSITIPFDHLISVFIFLSYYFVDQFLSHFEIIFLTFVIIFVTKLIILIHSFVNFLYSLLIANLIQFYIVNLIIILLSLSAFFIGITNTVLCYLLQKIIKLDQFLQYQVYTNQAVTDTRKNTQQSPQRTPSSVNKQAKYEVLQQAEKPTYYIHEDTTKIVTK